uniref:Uncharacterized protein n=1 Tax=Nothobranchius furzeri TaxID=105023 RepID=A0A1A8U0M0_NOTFU
MHPSDVLLTPSSPAGLVSRNPQASSTSLQAAQLGLWNGSAAHQTFGLGSDSDQSFRAFLISPWAEQNTEELGWPPSAATVSLASATLSHTMMSFFQISCSELEKDTIFYVLVLFITSIPLVNPKRCFAVEALLSPD